MKPKALSLNYIHVVFVVMFSLMLSVFLIPTHFSEAAEVDPQGKYSRESMSDLIKQLQAKIKELETRASEARAKAPEVKLPTVTITEIATDMSKPVIYAKYKNFKSALMVIIVVKDSQGNVVYTNENDKKKPLVLYADAMHKIDKELKNGSSYTVTLMVDGKELVTKSFTINTSKPILADYRAYDADGNDLENIEDLDRKEALQKCLKVVVSDRSRKVYCDWNNRVVYNTDPRPLYGEQTPPNSSDTTSAATPETSSEPIPPKTTSVTELGEYKGYYTDGYNFITNKSISKSNALVHCAKNAAQDRTRKVYCTWNGKVIYGTKPLTTTNTATNADTTSNTNESGSAVSDTVTPTPPPVPAPTTVKPPTTTTPPKPPSYYYESGRGGDIRGAATTNPQALLATILAGLLQILDSLE